LTTDLNTAVVQFRSQLQVIIRGRVTPQPELLGCPDTYDIHTVRNTHLGVIDQVYTMSRKFNHFYDSSEHNSRSVGFAQTDTQTDKRTPPQQKQYLLHSA